MTKIKNWFTAIDKPLLITIIFLFLSQLLCVYYIPYYTRLGLSENIFFQYSLTQIVLASLCMLATSALSKNWIKKIAIIIGIVAIISFGILYVEKSYLTIISTITLLVPFVVLTAAFLCKQSYPQDKPKKMYPSIYFLFICALVLLFAFANRFEISVAVLLTSMMTLLLSDLQKNITRPLFWGLVVFSLIYLIFLIITSPALYHNILNWLNNNVLSYAAEMSIATLSNAPIIGNGDLTYINRIPDGLSYFVFASMSGYFGYLFSITVLLMLGFIISRLAMHARNSKTAFSKYLIIATCCLISVQTILHLLSNYGLIPLITLLPFVSYAMPTTLVYGVLSGFILSVTRKPQEK